MTTAPPRQEPPYARIVADIRARIASGDLRAGDRVPSTRQITRRWEVAMATASKALATLRQEGLVHAVPGVGTVVHAAPPAVDPPAVQRHGTDRQGTGRGHPRAAETALNRETIVRVAIAIADVEGVSGLSMRRVAAELGVSTMALYRHVAGKDQLVASMADAVFCAHPLPETPPDDWRDGLESAARLQWAMFRRHPWLAQTLFVPRPLLVPGGMAHTEWLLRVLNRHARLRNAAQHALVSLVGYIMGMAGQVGRETEEVHETGIDADQWWASQDSLIVQLAATGRFPHLMSTAEPPDIDAAFEFGLLRLLDGFTVFFDR